MADLPVVCAFSYQRFSGVHPWSQFSIDHLPFTSVEHNRLNARFNDFDYEIQIDKGYLSNKKVTDFAFIIHPEKDNLVINLSTQ